MKIIMLFIFCCLLGIKFIIEIFYYVKDFIKNNFKTFPIFNNLSTEYEANNVVRKSVINSNISCQLEINTELPKYNKIDEFFNAALSGNIEIAKTILSTGYNINTIDKNGATALMYAVTSNKKDVIKFLIESGININAKDNFGRSAICYALLAQKTENIQYLLDNGADINTLDIYKNNLLIYALNISNNYAHPVNDIIRVLLSNNIKLNSLENIGISEIDYVIRQKVDADVITQLYMYKYGNEVTFNTDRNSLSIYRNSLKILIIKFSMLSDGEYISEFIEFNANGNKQVITHNNIFESKIVGSLIGIYDFQGQIFHGFGIDRSKKTIFELDDDTLLEFAKLDIVYGEDFPMNTPTNKEKIMQKIKDIIIKYPLKYYIIALIVIILLVFNSTGNTIDSFKSPESSFISGAQYDSEKRELLVNIHNNSGKSQYKYYNVDKRTFDKFKSSESKGTFFNQNIRNHYDYRRTQH